MALTGSVTYQINANKTGLTDLERLADSIAYSKSKSFVDGTGAGKVQLLWSDSRSLAASASEDIDLAGSLVDGLGKILTFTKIKVLLVHAAPANNNANKLIVSRPASNGLVLFGAASGSLAPLDPDGLMLIVNPTDGIAVTPSTGDLLHIANGAGTNTINYEIVILGEGTAA